MSKTSRTFDAALQAFVKSNKNAMECALECSHLAIDHFYEHGDTTYLKRFHDALTENWNRVAAFRKWMRDFCPVKADKDGNLSKNTERASAMWSTEEAKATLLAKAKSEPFWTYAKDSELKPFDFEKDLIGAMQAAIRRARSEKIFRPDTIAQNAVKVDQAERMVKALKAGTIASILPVTPKQETPTPSKLVRNGQLVGEVPVAA